MSKLPAVQKLVLTCKENAEENPFVARKCDDVITACILCMENRAVKHLTQQMRESLINGIQDCLYHVSQDAWHYYSSHDVPLSEKNIPLLRTICEYHYS